MNFLNAKPNVADNKINTNTNKDLVKTTDISNFLENYTASQPNLAEEEAFAFAGLTGNDILQVSNNSNYSINNASLNTNILDSVLVTNSIKPTELIKLQKANSNYFTRILSTYTTVINTTTGIATVTIPKAGTSGSYRMQVETFTPKVINNATIY